MQFLRLGTTAHSIIFSCTEFFKLLHNWIFPFFIFTSSWIGISWSLFNPFIYCDSFISIRVFLNFTTGLIQGCTIVFTSSYSSTLANYLACLYQLGILCCRWRFLLEYMFFFSFDNWLIGLSSVFKCMIFILVNIFLRASWYQKFTTDYFNFSWVSM